MFNEQHKKERPVLGLLGMGGGIARGGGAAPVPSPQVEETPQQELLQEMVTITMSGHIPIHQILR